MRATPRAVTDAENAAMRAVLLDPRRFAHSYFRRHLMEHQVNIVRSATHPNTAPFGNKYTAVRSGHGVGKSFTASIAVQIFLQLNRRSICITTAPTKHQVKSILWKEIGSLITLSHNHPFSLPGGRVLCGIPGVVNQTEWKLGRDWMAFGLSTNDAVRFQGIHAPNVMIVFDEASGVPDEIYEAANAIAVGPEDKILAIGNPTAPSGWFRDIWRNANAGAGWNKIHINCEQLPWVLDKVAPPAPGLATWQWVEEMRAKWGERFPAIYEIRVRGNFCDVAGNMLMSMSDVEACCCVDDDADAEQTSGVTSIGVDVARYGDDATVCTRFVGGRQTHKERWQQTSIPETVGRIIALFNEWGGADVIAVDQDGLGAGVFDYLDLENFPVLGHIGAAKAMDERKFANCRAENYFALADDIKSHRLTLLRDDDQTAQLSYIPYKFDNKGRILIEKKEKLKRDGYPSPDDADAVMMAHWGQRAFLSGVFSEPEVVNGAMG